ncbi:alpha/beta hydrolase [Herbiconiux sp.]|uniref:alpha/beta hydrolase n=1 Tax=Herbiconiux sp. TaxID=1871186 RepID=UPI0025C5A762|nr:alpha/beta hydrolase [Herbiconiux sp.]
MNRPLDPHVATLLGALDQTVPAPENATPEMLRAGFGNLMALLHPDAPAGFPGTIRDDVVETGSGPVTIRVYDPAGSTGDDVVVFFHGGGWVLGGLDSAEPAVSALATAMAVRIVSVDYRLAPEHPYPAAYDDCLAVTRSIAASNPGWLGVAGDSAGGNLASAVALAAPANGFTVDAQLLLYPALDPTMGTDSYTEFADGYLLTREAMEFYWASYRGDPAVARDSLTPYRAESLERMPPTVITTAGYDPLRDEGARFAARLVESGVPTTFLPAPSLIHGWADQIDLVPAAAEALRHAAAAFDQTRHRHGSALHTNEGFHADA